MRNIMLKLDIAEEKIRAEAAEKQALREDMVAGGIPQHLVDEAVPKANLVAHEDLGAIEDLRARIHNGGF